MLDAWRRLQPTRLLTPPWTRLHRRHNPVSPLPWFRDHDVHLNGQEAFVQALSSCELARAWQHQLFLADAMQREGYGRCLPGFHALMHSKHWEEAIGLLEVMKLQGFSPTSSTFSFVVRSCGRAGQWRWPLKLISHGTDVDGTEGTDKELCNAVAAACQQAGEWQWSVWVLEQFGQSASGPGLSDSSFKLAITACKEGRHWLRALQMLGSVEQTLAQSEFLLSSTLKACGARWQICLALVDSFDAFALPVVMTSLISACERARKWEAALLFLERMASPASTDPVALSSAMSACVQATEWQRAMALAFSHSGSLDAVVWSVLASACERGDSWELALQVFDEIANRYSPNVVVFGALLRSSPPWRATLHLLSYMTQTLMPSATCISEAVTTYTRSSQVFRALSLKPFLARRAVQPEVWAPLHPLHQSSQGTYIYAVVLAALLHDMSCWNQAAVTMYQRSFLMPLRADLLRRMPGKRAALQKVCSMGGGFLRSEAECFGMRAGKGLLLGRGKWRRQCREL
ncbi:unnamed protein product [Durusdinium trenchii]|uniref:Pentatricopeptide repeat-containing protein, chloroplastic n=1 Tax=Durusdinium trenchii TaxID=1381693 RepID=A0ABP0I8Y7_9DINO